MRRLALGALIAVMVGSPGAQAALPGRNGKIAYEVSTVSGASGEFLLSSVWMSGRANRPISDDSDPAYSPTGRRLVTAHPFGAGLRIGRSDGRGRWRALTHGGDGEPDFSPRGTQVVFSRDAYPSPSEIRIYSKGRSRRIGFGLNPAWSVRGRIAYEGVGADGVTTGTIFTMRADGGDVRSS
jgi:hypothetical protein